MKNLKTLLGQINIAKTAKKTGINYLSLLNFRTGKTGLKYNSILKLMKYFNLVFVFEGKEYKDIRDIKLLKKHIILPKSTHYAIFWQNDNFSFDNLSKLLNYFNIEIERILKEPKNLKEFRALIEKYESITMKQLKSVYNYGVSADLWEILGNITGFGTATTCSLCEGIGKKSTPLSFQSCAGCVYLFETREFCNFGINHNTYNKIERAETMKELLKAIKSRARHMRGILKEYESKILITD